MIPATRSTIHATPASSQASARARNASRTPSPGSLPFWNDSIAPTIRSGKRVVIAAHGNSIRALIKYLDNVSDSDIVGLNIPTAQPLVYELDADLRPIRNYYLGDARRPSRPPCRRSPTRARPRPDAAATPVNPKPPGLTRLRVDRFLLATGICLLWGLAPAYGASVERKKEELQDLKGRIEALRRDMTAAEESRGPRSGPTARGGIGNLHRQSSPARTGP
jgi:hypothetical protein